MLREYHFVKFGVGAWMDSTNMSWKPNGHADGGEALDRDVFGSKSRPAI